MPNSLFLPFCGSETQYVSEPKGIKKQKKNKAWIHLDVKWLASSVLFCQGFWFLYSHCFFFFCFFYSEKCIITFSLKLSMKSTLQSCCLVWFFRGVFFFFCGLFFVYTENVHFLNEGKYLCHQKQSNIILSISLRYFSSIKHLSTCEFFFFLLFSGGFWASYYSDCSVSASLFIYKWHHL